VSFAIRIARPTPIAFRAVTSSEMIACRRFHLVGGSVNWVSLFAANSSGLRSHRRRGAAEKPPLCVRRRVVEDDERHGELSPGAAKRGQLLCTISGERTSTRLRRTEARPHSHGHHAELSAEFRDGEIGAGEAVGVVWRMPVTRATGRTRLAETAV